MSAVRRSRALGIVCAVVVAVAARCGDAVGQDTRALSLMEQASARYGDVSTLCADFQQTLTIPLLGEEHSGHGRLCQARPDRFAMRFTEPDGDAVVLDGTSIWLYYPSTDPLQVLRLPVGEAPGQFDLYEEFLDRPAQKYEATYEGREDVAGRAAHRIRLVPRSATSYLSAVVWLDAEDRLLRKVVVEEENGSTRSVTLTGVTLNGPTPEGWFTFTPPPGAQVISG